MIGDIWAPSAVVVGVVMGLFIYAMLESHTWLYAYVADNYDYDDEELELITVAHVFATVVVSLWLISQWIGWYNA